MTELSFPQVELPLSDDEWKTITLPMGRGIIDRGGHPYKLTNLDSVTDTVTIGLDSVHGRNEAILDGFVHRIDHEKQLTLAPVSTETVYEIGLAYNPLNHGSAGGPIGLYAWKAPGDTTGGKSLLVLYRVTRKPNLSLANSPWTEERPRVCPVISVSRESQLPVSGLVLVDTVGVVRTTNEMFRADIDGAGAITWTPIGSAGGGDFTNSTASIDAAVDQVQAATWDSVPNTLIERGGDGAARVKNAANSHNENILNLGTADGRYSRPGHTHNGSDITSRIPFEHVDGSHAAWQNSNLGSQWTSLAVNSDGFLGRYPSALKYKQNIRKWTPDPRKILELDPVKYDVRTDVAGSSESSDKGLVGFLADSYVESLRELVLVVGGEVEGFHYHLVGVAQQVVLRYLDERVTALEAENETLRFNQNEILSYLGLNVDANGRVITEGGV